jgi:hypothetical protein
MANPPKFKDESPQEVKQISHKCDCGVMLYSVPDGHGAYTYHVDTDEFLCRDPETEEK